MHLRSTTPETSLEKSFSPASALNSHKLLEQMDTKKSLDANRLNKSRADSPDKGTANQEGT